MIAHLFKVGDVVRPRSPSRHLPHDRFRILRLLPTTAGGVPFYCIKGEAETIERVVEQNEIESVPH